MGREKRGDRSEILEARERRGRRVVAYHVP
jgi:hypothetical protein